MPITFAGRSISTGNLSPMIPIVTNNPAFKVAILPVDGRYEEKAGLQKSDNKEQAAVKIGDHIAGEVVSDTKKKGKKVAGKVLQVLKNNQDIYAYRILDTEGDEVEVDPTTVIIQDPNSHQGDANESYVLTYENWLVENVKLPANQWIDISMSSLNKEELDLIWKMYTDTYSKEGMDFSADDEGELKSKYKATFLKDIDADNLADAFIIYKETKCGNKIALLGTNDKKDAKRDVIKKVIELLNKRGWFIEASLKMEQILSSSNVPVIYDEKMINDIVGADKKPELEDKGYYTRLLSKASKRIRKRMYGVPR
jgi:hypothetical protein